jgi:GNAT superfamily N-acetyltransferase
MPELRPMTTDDVAEVHELNVRSFEDFELRRGRPLEPRPDPAMAHVRYRHLVETDPGGAWVAVRDGAITGCALALRREDVWGLSLLVVRPDQQSAGVGRALLARAHEYAEGCRGRIILSSEDPRAVRAYARLGLELHPSISASGVPAGVTAPAGVYAGGPEDVPFTEHVDRQVRRAAHGPDFGAYFEMGQTLLIVPDRGYVVVGDGREVRLLAALDAAAARDTLRAALAFADGREILVNWITARQQWAVDVCAEARLELRTGAGAVFHDGDVGPFAPYLPSGAFL